MAGFFDSKQSTKNLFHASNLCTTELGLTAKLKEDFADKSADKASVLSFVLAGYKTEEVGTELNREGIAVRSGYHCAQPILRRFGLEATVRPSFAFYNTCEEIDLLVSVVERLAKKR